MMRVLIGLLFLSLGLAGCSEVQEAEFRKISNVRFSMDGPKVTADLTFFNPNNFSMVLKRSEVDVFFDGKKAGRIDQSHQIKVAKQSEFIVPIDLQVSLKDLGLGNALMGILSGKKYPLRFQGKVFGQVKGVPVSVNIDHTEDIRIGK